MYIWECSDNSLDQMLSSFHQKYANGDVLSSTDDVKTSSSIDNCSLTTKSSAASPVARVVMSGPVTSLWPAKHYQLKVINSFLLKWSASVDTFVWLFCSVLFCSLDSILYFLFFMHLFNFYQFYEHDIASVFRNILIINY